MKIPENLFQISIGLNHKHPHIQQITQNILKKNPGFQYCLITSEYDMWDFVVNNSDEFPGFIEAYSKINILIAKIDMFRYLLLYKFGGVYLDMDSDILQPICNFVGENDDAVITAEGNPNKFVQWMLVFNSGHPILKRTITYVIENILQNRFPNNIYDMTGPTVYSRAIFDLHRENFEVELIHSDIRRETNILCENSNISYRIFGVDYNGCASFQYNGKEILYRNANAHWKKQDVPLLIGTAGSVRQVLLDLHEDV